MPTAEEVPEPDQMLIAGLIAPKRKAPRNDLIGILTIEAPKKRDWLLIVSPRRPVPPSSGLSSRRASRGAPTVTASPSTASTAR
jgi:hypothetical protein